MPFGRSLATLLATAALVASRPAGAYVRTRATDSNVPLYWPSPVGQLEVTRPPVGFPVADDDFRAEVAGALAAWSFPALDCTKVSLSLTPGFADSETVAFDGHNRIITRTGAWCRDPDACTKPYDTSQLAITTVFSRSHPGALDDGEIIEADIELDDVGVVWAVLPDDPTSDHGVSSYDLRSALTHEVGHLIGLAHDCLLPGEAPRFDDAGNLSPDCYSIPDGEDAQIRGATMYALMNPIDVTWRSLSDDDARAACDIYPNEGQVVVGWCDVGASGGDAASSVEGLGLFGGLAAVALVGRAGRLRRRRSRRAAS